VDQNAITDARVRQSVGLIQPTPNGARVAACVSGEGLEIDKIVEEVCMRHWCSVLTDS
jgi:hypothetical protein